MNLSRELEKLEIYIEIEDSTKSSISQVSTYRHLMHSICVVDDVIDALQDSDPNTYMRNFNPTRCIVFLSWWIPRWAAQSPAHLKEFGKITKELLKTRLGQVKDKISLLEELDSHSHFGHSRFGQMNLVQTKRFLVLHTHHHIKIIKDILHK